MIRRVRRVAPLPFVLLCLCSVGGCRSVVPGPLPEHAGAPVQRNAGYSILLDVLDEESRVAGILEIKDTPAGLSELIGRIAESAAAGASALRAELDRTPEVTPGSSGLPAVEIEARSRIARQTTVALVAGRGSRFRRDLVLSQLKATEYVAALADGLLRDEPSSRRAESLESIRKRFDSLHVELLGWVEAAPRSKTTAPS